MSTIPLDKSPQNSLPASRGYQSPYPDINASQLATSDETEKVAKKFEALLIHNMLKAMRSTTLGEKPSNERAMYDDMFDQHLAKNLADTGGLGIADSIRRQLNAQSGAEDDHAQSDLNSVTLNMNGMGNRSSTLEYNDRLTSSLQNIEQYQAMMHRAKQETAPTDLNYGAIESTDVVLHPNIDKDSLINKKSVFINNLMPDARRGAARLGVQPEIVIAIAALESGWGKHVVKDSTGVSSHNLFGIKARGTDTPQTMHKTTEYVNNKPITVEEPFRRYSSNSSAVSDFADFLLSNPRYKNALSVSADNNAFLVELQRAGYATDPNYAKKAINVLQEIENLLRSPAL